MSHLVLHLTLVAERSSLGVMASMFKEPPVLECEEKYETWRRDIKLWATQVCSIFKVPNKGVATLVHLSLSGRAREATSELSDEDLEADNGLDKLLERLDRLFLLDKGTKQFVAFKELFNMRRQGGVSVREFVGIFEHMCFKLKSLKVVLPDAVKAFMLLATCGLEEEKTQLILTGLSEITYDTMAAALVKVFSGVCSGLGSVLGSGGSGGGVVGDGGVMIKSEPVLALGGAEKEYTGSLGGYNEGEGALFSARGGARGRYRGRGSGRGRQPSVSGVRGDRSGDRWRRVNPVGSDGNVSRCSICDSRFHWARECPDSYESRESRLGKTDSDSRVMSRGGRFGKSSNQGYKDETNSYVSWFVGYAGRDGGKDRLNSRKGVFSRLVEEARGCAVMDSGCSTTVCGAGWYEEYVRDLSDVEKSNLIVEESEATFTFGDGVTVPSVMRVRLPCLVGGTKVHLATDVVECQIPLLLSKMSMKKARMIINFGTDQVDINGKKLKLLNAESGHYLLPLSA